MKQHPLSQIQIQTIELIDIIEEAPNTKTYYFTKPSDFTWQEGAHTHMRLLDKENTELNRSMVRHMSISTLPEEQKIGITTRVPGSNSPFKEKLLTLQPNDQVELFKWGSRMHLQRRDKPLILLSMGVGIATLRPVILAYCKDSTNIPSLTNINVDSSNQHIFRSELDQHVNETYQNIWVTSRQAFYERLNESLKSSDAIYYVVGSDEFIRSVIQRLLEANIDKQDIVIDKRNETREMFLDIKHYNNES